ncbi:MAG: hypothetical protein ACP5XB_01325 [Isosphaeraceae bacterium]
MAASIAAIFNRDKQARWYADRHMNLDDGVVRIYYLPTNAPPREIRLLEVNRMLAETTPLEPIDFGVGMNGEDAHTLYVLDVTPAQWEAIQRDEVRLPEGWTLDNSQELTRPQNS